MTSAKTSIPAAKIALYEKLLAMHPNIERKGHNAPPGTLAIRLGPDDVAAFLKKYKTTLFESYGVVKKDWVVVPDALLKKTGELKPYLQRGLEYVRSLKPKSR